MQLDSAGISPRDQPIDDGASRQRRRTQSERDLEALISALLESSASIALAAAKLGRGVRPATRTGDSIEKAVTAAADCARAIDASILEVGYATRSMAPAYFDRISQVFLKFRDPSVLKSTLSMSDHQFELYCRFGVLPVSVIPATERDAEGRAHTVG